MIDFTYTRSEGFYTVFPESANAEKTISEMIRTFGSNKLLPFEFESFRKHLQGG